MKKGERERERERKKDGGDERNVLFELESRPNVINLAHSIENRLECSVEIDGSTISNYSDCTYSKTNP